MAEKAEIVRADERPDLRAPAGVMLPVVAEFEMMRQMADAICQTEFVPKALRGRPDAALAAIMYGRELGLGAMQAMSRIHIIEGHPTMGAELMLSMIRRAGHEIIGSAVDNRGVSITGKRGDTGEQMTVTFTMEDAARIRVKQDGKWIPLADTTRYKNYPADMCWARAVSRMARRLFSDAMYGVVYTPEDFGVIDPEADQVAESYITGEDLTEAGVVPALTGMLPRPDDEAKWWPEVKRETVKYVLSRRPDLKAWSELDEAEQTAVATEAKAKLAEALESISLSMPNEGEDLMLTEAQAQAIFEHIKEHPQTEPEDEPGLADQALEESWWTELVGLVSGSVIGKGTADDIEVRTRTLYRLMRALGLWEDAGGVDRLHLDLAVYLQRTDPENVHYSDLRVKANKKAFAEKMRDKARETIQAAGKEPE